MTYRKRKSQKTGANTRRTTTQSSKGTRITNSTSSSLGGKNKRTYSWSWSKGGRLKQTFTDNVNGYVKRRSRTLGSPPKRTKKYSSSRSSGGSGLGGVGLLIGLLILGAVLLASSFPLALVIVGIVAGLWLFWILLPFLIWILIFFVIFWLFF